MARAHFPVVVHVLLSRVVAEKDQIYLQRRQNTGVLDGYFSLPGGHLEPGELPLAAAEREMAEETGVTGTPLRPLALLPYATRRGSGLNLVFGATLAAAECSRHPVLAEPELADLALWADVAALPEPMPGWIGQLLELRAKEDWYGEVR